MRFALLKSAQEARGASEGSTRSVPFASSEP